MNAQGTMPSDATRNLDDDVEFEQQLEYADAR